MKTDEKLFWLREMLIHSKGEKQASIIINKYIDIVLNNEEDNDERI